MPYKIIMMFLFCVAAQMAYADKMDLDKAEWICPSSVKEKEEEHVFKQIQVYDGLPEENRILQSETGNDMYQYQYSGLENRKNIYLVCQYDRLENDIIIHAEGAEFCGMKKTNPEAAFWQGACWEKPSDWPDADKPDISKAKWVCPSNIKIKGVEYWLTMGLIYDGSPEEKKVIAFDDKVRKGSPFRDLDGMDVYLKCNYANAHNNNYLIDVDLILTIHARGATFCGYELDRKEKNKSAGSIFYTVCWDTPRPRKN